MPTFFNALCGDCSHEWDAFMFSERIGHPLASTPEATYFCQDCYTHLRIATDFDRLSWKNWLKGNQSRIEGSELVACAVAMIDEICDSSSGYLLVMDYVWPRLWCPACDRPLIKGSIHECPMRSPRCLRRNARLQDMEFVTVDVADD